MKNPARRIAFFALLLSGWMPALAQLPAPCPSNLEPPADFCGFVCTYCDFPGGFLSTTTGYTGQMPPGDFCGSIENEQWMAFVAGEGVTTLTATPSNCQAGNGVQIALYPSCNEPPIACDGGASGNGNTPVSITESLIPGKTYYILIDGFAGDQCDFSIDINPPLSGTAPPIGPSDNIQSPSIACPGATFTTQLPAPVSGAGAYVWSAPPGWLVNGQPAPVEVLSQDGFTVSVTAGQTSGQVCVLPVNACNSGQQVCKNIQVQPIPPTVFPTVTVCSEALPYVLPWGDPVVISGSYQQILTSFLGCDSVLRQTVIVLPPIVTNLGVVRICDGDCFDVCGVSFCDPGPQTAVCTSFRGCDSTVIFTLQIQTPPERGLVFRDWNSNGARESGEPVLSGVEVRTSAGQVTTSAANGLYAFANLTQGDTLFVVNPPNSLGAIPAFYVYDTLKTTCYDFAIPPVPGSAFGKVFYDLNGDNTFNGADLPAVGAEVNATGAVGQLTDALGNFAFSGLIAGDTLTVVLPADAESATPTLYIYQAGKVLNYDFALTPAPAPASGLVYWDLDNNGVFDPTDLPANGMVIQVNGDSATVTDATGMYTADSLRVDDIITITPPVGAQGIDPPVQLFKYGQSGGYDFRIIPGKIEASGVVFIDVDGDNTFTANDLPAKGIFVRSGNRVVITDATGAYGFNQPFALAVGETIQLDSGQPIALANPTLHTVVFGQADGYNFAVEPAPFAVTGRVFSDFDANGVQNGVEGPAPGVTVYTSSGAVVTTGMLGEFTFPALHFGDTIRVVPLGPPSYSIPDFRIVTFYTPSGYLFGLTPTATDIDRRVIATLLGVPRPGFVNDIRVTVQNQLAPVTDGEVKLILPDWLEVVSFDPMPTKTNGDTICWNTGPMGAFSFKNVKATVRTPAAQPIGTPVNIQAWILPLSPDLFPLNNYSAISTTVQGAYDPNDKQVVPEKIPLDDSLAFNRPIEYTIRFQNTGTLAADFVVLRDTLSADLDLRTFTFLASSHPCTWQIWPGGILEIDFQGINLPDSATSPLESQGFAKFSVQPRGAFPRDHEFRNFADIYFDFNPPIRTNTAITKVVDQLIATFRPNRTDDRLSLRPNPARELVHVQWSTPSAPGDRLLLFSAAGQRVLERAVPPGSTRLEW